MRREIRCFTGPVAGAAENRAAHGGHTVREICARCGAVRLSNANGAHEETGPWSASLEARQVAAQAAVRAIPPITVGAGTRVAVLPAQADGHVLITLGGETRSYELRELRAQVTQVDPDMRAAWRQILQHAESVLETYHRELG